MANNVRKKRIFCRDPIIFSLCSREVDMTNLMMVQQLRLPNRFMSDIRRSTGLGMRKVVLNSRIESIGNGFRGFWTVILGSRKRDNMFK